MIASWTWAGEHIPAWDFWCLEEVGWLATWLLVPAMEEPFFECRSRDREFSRLFMFSSLDSALDLVLTYI